MSKLKDKAAVLRQVAADLESHAREIPQSAQQLIRNFAPADTVVNCEQSVDISLLGLARYNVREHLVSLMGRQLGDYIVKKLDFLHDRDRSGLRRVEQFDNPFARLERYRVTLHVFTPAQLERLIQHAFVAGRDAQ